MQYLPGGMSGGCGDHLMNGIPIRIDGQNIVAAPGSTILEVAAAHSIRIPTLCHRTGYPPTTSCMICVVEDMDANRLLPACSMLVVEGMHIETSTATVREARKNTLDLLLSEHVGDCQAPCQRACPAQMNIPRMNRLLAENCTAAAIMTIKRDIALPAILGRICPAPCEKACHRRSFDGTVSICQLKRYAADADLAQALPFRPTQPSPSGKKVAVIGAGPTGLSAAYYLLQNGHTCHIYDDHPLPGGMLRYGVPEGHLDRAVLNLEIGRIMAGGASFYGNYILGDRLLWGELKDSYDAVVLATGTLDPLMWANSGLEISDRTIHVNRKTFETNIAGWYAGGNAIGEGRLAIRSAAHGKAIAASIQRSWDRTSTKVEPPRPFHSVIGKLQPGEAEEFLKEAAACPPIHPKSGFGGGFSEEEAVQEAARCFHCDCRKYESCRLRQYAEEYGSQPRRFRSGLRRRFRKVLQHDWVIYEPSKCIRCGLCVRITRAAGEEIGLTFVRRGFDISVEAPFGEPLSRALTKTALECVEACPTAALALRERKEK